MKFIGRQTVEISNRKKKSGVKQRKERTFLAVVIDIKVIYIFLAEKELAHIRVSFVCEASAITNMMKVLKRYE